MIDIVDNELNSYKSFIVKLTQSGIDEARNIILKNKIKKRKLEANNDSDNEYKSHLCLLCFNDNKSLANCFLKISEGSTGNANKHIEKFHFIKNGDLRLIDIEFFKKYKINKKDLLKNIVDLDILRRPYITNSTSTKSQFNSNYDFGEACTRLEIKLGLAFGSLKCDEFWEVLNSFKPFVHTFKDIPNRNSSKKTLLHIYEKKKKK